MNGKLSILALTLVGTFLAVSCSNDDDDDELIGNWVRVSDLDGKPRSNASAFVVSGKGYITGGYDGEFYYNDLWSYDPNVNAWTQKADFPGSKRSSAVGFATNSYGYVGTGYDGLNKLKDFYKYDPSSNSWTQIEDFPGAATIILPMWDSEAITEAWYQISGHLIPDRKPGPEKLIQVMMMIPKIELHQLHLQPMDWDM